MDTLWQMKASNQACTSSPGKAANHSRSPLMQNTLGLLMTPKQKDLSFISHHLWQAMKLKTAPVHLPIPSHTNIHHHFILTEMDPSPTKGQTFYDPIMFLFPPRVLLPQKQFTNTEQFCIDQPKLSLSPWVMQHKPSTAPKCDVKIVTDMFCCLLILMTLS